MKKVTRAITGWTDYPIDALGDKPGEKAPIRRVEVLGYDGNKYVNVVVIGTWIGPNYECKPEPPVEISFKSGYLYQHPGRSEIKSFFGEDRILHPKNIKTDKLGVKFGRGTIARYYAKQGIKIRRDRRGGFTFIN